MRSKLAWNAVGALGDCGDPALEFFVRRDLACECSLDARGLWDLPQARRILARQQKDGSWLFPGARPNQERGQDYDQLETYRWMRHLVELYGFDRRHPAIERAVAWLFSRQTSEGDFRGIYGRQYTPNYSGAITELAVKAGYGDAEPVERCFQWLLFMRQDDGGWAIPFRTAGRNLNSAGGRCTFQPRRSRPFSHMVTGMVLRAFAAHPRHRCLDAVHSATKLLAGRLMNSDRYPDRSSATAWQRPTFPFWYTDVISALDTLSMMGIEPSNKGVSRALDWLLSCLRADGLFHFNWLAMRTVPYPDHWLTLAVCRILSRWRLLNR